jgi:3-deoxy-D-manno-octulosonate 8-phosphate phosphatase (KDO 8-P phosphatase)
MNVRTLSEVEKRLEKIKLVALDVDGVLTDARVHWIKGQGWTRSYNIRDGFGLKLLHRAGIEVAFISGSNTEELKERISHLKIKHSVLGVEDKLPAFLQILKDLNLEPEQALYIGDELFDIPVLEIVGFSATVPDAVEAVRKRVHYITQARGGDGAVREVIDLLRRVQNFGGYND